MSTEDGRLPEGAILEVKMRVRLPTAATDDEITEWLEHNVGHQGGINVENPLYHRTPEPWGVWGTQWEDTGNAGHEERYNHRKTENGGEAWSVRYKEERRR